LKRVISGGQTGVDQAALRAARDAKLEIGGFCPPGRVCEGGVIPSEFPLIETPGSESPDAPQIPRSLRTQWNVRLGDATLIVRTSVDLDPGTAFAETCALHYGKPLRVVNLDEAVGVDDITGWLSSYGVEILNVAGPSENTVPGIGERAQAFLKSLFLGV
jgi:hypothetical protein